MITLISSIKELDKSILKNFIVIVELVNYTNIVKEKGNIGQIKATKIFNKLNQKMKVFNRELDVPEEESISKKTEELLIQLKNLNKEELFNRLITVIENKLSDEYIIKKGNFYEYYLEEAIIDSASEKYKINPEISTEGKIKMIKASVEKEMKELNAKYKEMSENDKEAMVKVIYQEIQELSPEEAEDLKKHLNIEQLSSEAIRDLLIKSGGALSLMMIPSLAGFSSYIALTTIMHAVFTTTLGITLPFAAYTGATSFMSILAGPVGWIGIGGLTAYNLRKNRNKLTQTIMAQIVGITALLSEDMKESMDNLPSWLSENKKTELIAIHKKLSVEQDKLKQLIVERDQLNQMREEAELQTKSLKDEVNALNSIIEDYDESSSNRDYLISMLKDKETQLKAYEENAKRSDEIVRELNIVNKNVKGYVELISQSLMVNQAKYQKGYTGELKVFTKLIEYLPNTYTTIAYPFLGEKAPDILLIHPEYGFRILEVKNYNINFINQIESNGILDVGSQNRRINPLNQVTVHVNQLNRYLSNNHPDLGDQYQNIGMAVIHVGFTKDDFFRKFRRTIDRWDTQTTEEYFKYHIFKDEINNGDLNKIIRKAKKFKTRFNEIPQEKINEIRSSVSIDSGLLSRKRTTET